MPEHRVVACAAHVDRALFQKGLHLAGRVTGVGAPHQGRRSGHVRRGCRRAVEPLCAMALGRYVGIGREVGLDETAHRRAAGAVGRPFRAVHFLGIGRRRVKCGDGQHRWRVGQVSQAALVHQLVEARQLGRKDLEVDVARAAKALNVETIGGCRARGSGEGRLGGSLPGAAALPVGTASDDLPGGAGPPHQVQVIVMIDVGPVVPS